MVITGQVLLGGMTPTISITLMDNLLVFTTVMVVTVVVLYALFGITIKIPIC